jgi:hypothetical protein
MSAVRAAARGDGNWDAFVGERRIATLKTEEAALEAASRLLAAEEYHLAAGIVGPVDSRRVWQGLKDEFVEEGT